MKYVILICLGLASCTSLPKETREKEPAPLAPIIERDTPTESEEQYLLYVAPALVGVGWLLYKLITEKDGKHA